MIDRLEEVLGRADSREEKSQLEELLRPWGAAAAAPVERGATSEEDAMAATSEPEESPEGRVEQSFPETGITGPKLSAAEQTGLPELLRGTEPVALPNEKRGAESVPEEWEALKPAAVEGELREMPAANGASEGAVSSPMKEEQAAALAALVGRAAERLTLSVPVRADHGALLTLYRQTAQAASPMGRAGISAAPVVIREEYAVGGGLTAQELDLAVRRDSRRYDGAVHIY